MRRSGTSANCSITSMRRSSRSHLASERSAREGGWGYTGQHPRTKMEKPANMATGYPAAYGSFRYNLNLYQIAIPLDAGFRFVHEPIQPRTQHRFVGRQSETEELVQRLQFSDGGSFLITGYRGVGKTSFVNQVLATLEQRVAVLQVQINLSRPLQPAELMHLIIRRIYDRLVQKNWYDLLTEKLQTELTLAYQRTSANVVRKLSDKWERSAELEAKIPGMKIPLTPKLGSKRLTTTSSTWSSNPEKLSSSKVPAK